MTRRTGPRGAAASRRPWRRAPPGAPAFYERAGLNVETYDARAEAAGTPIEGDVRFYVERARESGGPVLEIGSGTGRVAWSLAEAGVAVVGIEPAPAMLRAARAKAVARAPAVRRRARFVRGDVRTLDLGRRFPLALVPFRAFQMLLEPADQRLALARLRRHLRPGGRLVIDVFDPRLDWCHPSAAAAAGAAPEERARAARRSAAPLQRRTVLNPSTGRPVQVRVVSSATDPVTQVLTQVWRFTERGPRGEVLRREEELLRMRWTYRQEMRWLLELEGFEVEAELSDFHGSPAAYGREQVWIAHLPRRSRERRDRA